MNFSYDNKIYYMNNTVEYISKCSITFSFSRLLSFIKLSFDDEIKDTKIPL